MKTYLTRRRHGGFTLIELLVVVGIIAVLIAILIPSLAVAREIAKRTTCGTRIRGWDQAAQMYVAQNNGILPFEGACDSKDLPCWTEPSSWWNSLPGFMGTESVLNASGISSNQYSDLQATSDANNGGAPLGGPPLAIGPVNSFWVCPDSSTAQLTPKDSSDGAFVNFNGYFLGGYSTYTFNAATGNFSGGGIPQPNFVCYAFNSKLNGTITFDKMSDIPGASAVVLFTEKRMRLDEQPSDTTYSLERMKAYAKGFTTRHNGGGNIAFADGHVEYQLDSYVESQPDSANQGYNIPGSIVWDPYGTTN